MTPIIIIPARMASTRLPGKPLALIDGEPMIVHVWRRAMEAAAGEVVVACDGEAIAEAMKKAGGKAIITPADLPSGSDRIYDALMRVDPDESYDAIINLQGDMPTINPVLIRSALETLRSVPEWDIVTLAAEITDMKEKNDPSVVKVVIGHHPSISQNMPAAAGRALYFSRQAIPHGDGPLYHHIGLYAYRRRALQEFIGYPPSLLEMREKLEQLRALEAGMRIGVAIVDTVPLGVDTPETLEKARRIIKK